MDKIKLENKINLDEKVLEAIHTIRANIEFLSKDSKVIGITSCIGQEGKSLVAYNLALSIAKSQKKVILVNTNLRKENETTIYAIDKVEKGLSEYLSKQCKKEDIIHNTNIEDFYFISSGNQLTNPSELLSTDSFKRFIQELKEAYDYVILDTPAVGEVIDAAIAIHECDGAVLVMEPNVVSYELAQNCKKQIKNTGCKIIGVVLNMV